MIRTLIPGLALSALLCATAQAAPLPPPKPPSVNASNYILMDFRSEQIIAERESDARADPASITKLMTAFVVFDALRQGLMSIEDKATISRKAWRAEGSRMFVEVNSQVSVGELLKGMIIQSGNDAAIALAEHTAGSEESFADRMNQYAAELGLANTHYTNASGLTDEAHYTSARDIALLARELIRRFPEHYALYSEQEYTYNNITQRNRNRLLGRDPSVDGLKTGYTKAAGYCLASSAKRGDMRLISVVLGTPTGNARVSASETLLNYGFRFYESHQLTSGGAELGTTRIYKGAQEQLGLGRLQDTWVVVPRGQTQALELDQDVPGPLLAPVSAGQSVGELVVRHHGRELARMPLQSLQDMPLGSFWQRLRDEALMLLGG